MWAHARACDTHFLTLICLPCRCDVPCVPVHYAPYPLAPLGPPHTFTHPYRCPFHAQLPVCGSQFAAPFVPLPLLLVPAFRPDSRGTHSLDSSPGLPNA